MIAGLESLFNELNLTILNNGSENYLNAVFHSMTRSLTVIDLAISSVAISSMFEWEVHNDLPISDHFPKLLKPLFTCCCLRQRDDVDFFSKMLIRIIIGFYRRLLSITIEHYVRNQLLPPTLKYRREVQLFSTPDNVGILSNEVTD